MEPTPLSAALQIFRIRERFGDLYVGPRAGAPPTAGDCVETQDEVLCLAERMGRFRFPGTVERPLLKMTNIPWEVSSGDVRAFFHEYEVEIAGIHIPIDRASGKTRNEIYVEFSEFRELVDALARAHRQLLKSREVFLMRSSWIELLKAHFPRACKDALLTTEEETSLATICRYYKVLMRNLMIRCAERPFEHVYSLVRLAPWATISKSACAQMHAVVLSTVEALLGHLFKKQKSSCPCQQATNMALQSGLEISLAQRLLDLTVQRGQWDSAQLKMLEKKQQEVAMLESQRIPETSCCSIIDQLQKRISAYQENCKCQINCDM